MWKEQAPRRTFLRLPTLRTIPAFADTLYATSRPEIADFRAQEPLSNERHQEYVLGLEIAVEHLVRVDVRQTARDVRRHLPHPRLVLRQRELETLRPSLAQLAPNLNDSTEWYRPSNRRHYGNFATTTLRL